MNQILPLYLIISKFAPIFYYFIFCPYILLFQILPLYFIISCGPSGPTLGSGLALVLIPDLVLPSWLVSSTYQCINVLSVYLCIIHVLEQRSRIWRSSSFHAPKAIYDPEGNKTLRAIRNFFLKHLSLYSTRTQNFWRRVLLRHLTQKIAFLRHLTQEIPTCWYLWR